MADNYLENKMEEHRRSMASSGGKPRHAVSSRLSSHGAPRRGRLVVDFPPMNVLIVSAGGGDMALLERVAATFRSIDASVDLCAPAGAAGMAAQRVGACFLGLTANNFEALLSDVMARRKGAVDAVVALDRGAVELIGERAGGRFATCLTTVPDVGPSWLSIAGLADGDTLRQAYLLALLAQPRR